MGSQGIWPLWSLIDHATVLYHEKTGRIAMGAAVVQIVKLPRFFDGLGEHWMSENRGPRYRVKHEASYE